MPTVINYQLAFSVNQLASKFFISNFNRQK